MQADSGEFAATKRELDLFRALYISDHWYQSWEHFKRSKYPSERRMALKHKTIALIRADQMLNKEFERVQKVVDKMCEV